MLWKNYAFRSDLNEEASRNDSRLIEKPLMAGYYALEGTFGTVITVPVEHVYTRIWFDFQWRETPDAVQIVVDSVVVEGILENTRIFNTMEDRAANNPSNPVKSKTSIRNKEAEQNLFSPICRFLFILGIGEMNLRYFYSRIKCDMMHFVAINGRMVKKINPNVLIVTMCTVTSGEEYIWKMIRWLVCTIIFEILREVKPFIKKRRHVCTMILTSRENVITAYYGIIRTV